jgi:hypothetical protein
MRNANHVYRGDIGFVDLAGTKNILGTLRNSNFCHVCRRDIGLRELKTFFGNCQNT